MWGAVKRQTIEMDDRLFGGTRLVRIPETADSQDRGGNAFCWG